MKKFLLTTVLLLMACGAMMAAPAKRGVYKTLKLAGGQEVRAMLVGDEYGSVWKGSDGSGAGFGGGYGSACGDITIPTGVTSVTASTEGISSLSPSTLRRMSGTRSTGGASTASPHGKEST